MLGIHELADIIATLTPLTERAFVHLPNSCNQAGNLIALSHEHCVAREVHDLIRWQLQVDGHLLAFVSQKVRLLNKSSISDQGF